jgi:5-methylcytosine-specific restriction endonuclease McrA
MSKPFGRFTVATIPLFKQCARCKIDLPVAQFHKNNAKSDNLSIYCKDCAREMARASRLNNREKDLERKRQWRIDNPDKVKAGWQRFYRRNPNAKAAQAKQRHQRTRELPNWFPLIHKYECLKAWSFCCAYCGESQAMRSSIVWDHYIPLISPACIGTVRKNMLPACTHCNSQKNDILPEKWIHSKFGAERASIILRAIQEYFDSLGD